MDLLAVGSLYTQEGPAQAGGCVADVARAACAAGLRVSVATRVGLDKGGRDAVDGLRALGADVSAAQVDPDLPTPKRLVRGANVRLEPYAAFDNLQFDSDVESLARAAEAVVTDACSRRHGQGRSAIDRVLVTASNAVRVIDLVRRTPPEDRLDRECVGNALELAQVFVVDAAALRALVPAVADPIAAAERFAALDRARCVVALLGETTAVRGRHRSDLGAIPADRSPTVAVAVARAIVYAAPIAEALAGLVVA
jgi:fructokinase